MTLTFEAADRLLDRLKSEDDPTGVVANELLRHFFRGYPVQKLRPLLHSEDVAVRKRAAFIASELGSEAKPLLKDIMWLLGCPERSVRFDGIDVVQTCAVRRDGAIIARVIGMLDDNDPAIRWKAVHFVSRASKEQLEGALDAIPRDSIHTEPLRIIADAPLVREWSRPIKASEQPRNRLRGDSTESSEGLAVLRAWGESRLRDTCPLRRRYALAIALRLAPVDQTLLALAARSDDEEIKTAAREQLQREVSTT